MSQHIEQRTGSRRQDHNTDDLIISSLDYALQNGILKTAQYLVESVHESQYT